MNCARLLRRSRRDRILQGPLRRKTIPFRRLDASLLIFRGLIAALPVVVFLWGLVLIDSYKLVRLHRVLLSVLVGSAVAAAAYPLQTWLIGASGASFAAYSRFVAPLVEELIKAAFLIVLIRTHRVGFLVDAAIHGFAIGAGFSLAENLYYLQAASNMSFIDVVVRGFGTAIMHGGTTAIFAVLAKSFVDRDRWNGILLAWLVAAFLHAAFNQLLLPPLMMTLLLVSLLPLVFIGIFHRSEKATGKWLGSGFDSDQELLHLLLSEDLPGSRVGRYLNTLRAHFPGEIVADMLCYLRLHVELSMRAKGTLMMREAGFTPKPASDLKAKLDELNYLRTSIGPTGILAIKPFLHRSSQDLWQLHLLK